MTAAIRIAPALTGAALLLVVLSTGVEGHYLQIEWHTPTTAPLVWWWAADITGVVAVPLFLATAGLRLGAVADWPLADVLRTHVAPNLVWYALSVSATVAGLWRFGPVYGLPPVRDLPELLRLLLLPPTALALTYALALFPLLAWTIRALPGPLVLTAAAALTVMTGVVAALNPAWATAAGLTRNLLFFLAGWRLAATAGNRVSVTTPPMAGPLTTVGRAAAPIAALVLPATAAAGGILVRRLSTLDGPLQVTAAVVEPALFGALVVTAGLVAHRLHLAVPRLAGR